MGNAPRSRSRLAFITACVPVTRDEHWRGKDMEYTVGTTNQKEAKKEPGKD
jgi:hypothetical protein